jgi:hypothetical protein
VRPEANISDRSRRLRNVRRWRVHYHGAGVVADVADDGRCVTADTPPTQVDDVASANIDVDVNADTLGDRGARPLSAMACFVASILHFLTLGMDQLGEAGRPAQPGDGSVLFHPMEAIFLARLAVKHSRKVLA